MVKDNLVPATDSKRSALSLNKTEAAFAGIVALVTWFGVLSFLHSLVPFSCGDTISNIPINYDCAPQQLWQTLGLPLFSRFVIPLVLFNALAGVFLVRSFRRDVRDFSVLGSLALAWPLISTLAIHFLFYFGLCILPVGFALSIPATILSVEEKRDRLDWVSLPLSFISMVVCGWYLSQLVSLYGD
jgi:hypothetical protein